MSNDCKRYTRGSCIDGDNVGKCVGKDVCGAYEPKCTNLSYGSEEDMRISVAHLREVLEELASVRGIVNESVDEIINRVKKEK